MSIKHSIAANKFYHFFQPITDLRTKTTIGFESLLRSSIHTSPLQIFQDARQEDQLFELDTWSIQKGLTTYYDELFPHEQGLLFINIFPSTIVHPGFPAFIHSIKSEELISNKRVVLELSESESMDQIESLRDKILQLKELGFLIAIDDIGKGYSSFQTLIELEPDFLKLDLYFGKDLPYSARKQSLIELFSMYAEKHNSHLILEGIETSDTITCAKQLGIPLGQGYYLGKPEPLTTYKIRCFS